MGGACGHEVTEDKHRILEEKRRQEIETLRGSPKTSIAAEHTPPAKHRERLMSQEEISVLSQDHDFMAASSSPAVSEMEIIDHNDNEPMPSLRGVTKIVGNINEIYTVMEVLGQGAQAKVYVS